MLVENDICPQESSPCFLYAWENTDVRGNMYAWKDMLENIESIDLLEKKISKV